MKFLKSREAILLADIPEQLHRADLVISSTASQLPLLGKGAVESALKKRKHKPMFMLDIAVPRDIEQQVAELEDAYLYTVDDLQSIVAQNLTNRQQAAEQAKQMISVGVAEFAQWQTLQGNADWVRDYRQRCDTLRNELLAIASWPIISDTLKLRLKPCAPVLFMACAAMAFSSS